MRLIRAALAGIALLVSASTAWAVDLDEVMADLADGFIRPAYDDFAGKAGSMETAMSALCAAPSVAAAEAARSAFSQAAASWANAEMLRAGPVLENNRLERILFYPDRKGTGLKQVQAALEAKDASLADAGALAKRSVAMQGFGALDFVLDGTGAETLAAVDGGFRCRYGLAIAQNIHVISVELQSAWVNDGAVDKAWKSQGADNPFAHNDREALNLVLGTIIHGLEMARDVRIGGFLDVENGKDRPKAALYWRSQNTVRAAAENLLSLQAIFEKSGLDRALPDDQAYIADSIRFDFKVTIDALQALEMPVETLLADEKARKKLVFVHNTLGDLTHRFDQDFAIASGLAGGFSFGDGD
jgi:uncharacterized protein